jgi:nucleotide-binding universal stress UspA family protein
MDSLWNIVVPIDGSAHAERAVRLVLGFHARLAPVTIHLLHVRAPGPSLLDSPPLDEKQVFARARALLDAARVPYTHALRDGYVGAAIAAYVRENRCDAVVMGTRGMGSTEELLGSIARQVIQLCDVPVTLVK